MQERALEILRGLGAVPAVPFHEHGPARYIEAFLRGLSIDARRDHYGNIIAHYATGEDTSRPPIAFVAHMDHPGFEVIEVEGDRAVARALGAVPAASLVKPTSVLIVPPGGEPVPARTRPVDSQAPQGPDRRCVLVRPLSQVRLTPSMPVVFDLPSFEMRGETIHMRALDDLAGCAAILAALERVAAEEVRANLYAVFTRAEEVGLIGARLLASSEELPRETTIVSVESSPVIPGVVQGDGPVIRTGDAMSTFDDDAEQALRGAAARLRERDGGFRAQRRLMSGGVCEATAFAARGYRVTGIAFPLGNYHNATTRLTDPDGGVGAEYIERSDFAGGVDLIAEAAVGSVTGDASSGPLLAEVPNETRDRLKTTDG